MSEPLADHFAARGFETMTWRGATLPRTTAGVDAELAAARQGAALASLGWLAHVRATGRHRARFVHNMTTCEVKKLAPGQGNFGVFVDRRGRVVSDLQLDCEEDALLIELPRALRASTVAHVLQFRVADDVQFDADIERAVLAVVGPHSDAVIAAACGADVAAEPGHAYAYRDLDLGGVAARVRRNPRRLDLPGWDVTVAPSDAVAVWSALEQAGAAPIGGVAWHILRVEAGWPEVGVDITDDHTPLESDRLYATVDWDKGCYVGQEVIAMSHYRGKPNKQLVALAVEGGDASALATGDDVTQDGKAVGRLGSVVDSRVIGGTLALAAVKRKLAEPGTTLDLPGGARGVVRAWPLAPL